MFAQSPMEAAGWAALPAELQLQVLALLPGAALPTLRLMSRRWRDLADDPSLRGKFHLVVDPGMPPEEIQKLVASKPRLITVTMQDHQLSKALLMAMVFHPGLATLHLRGAADTEPAAPSSPLYRLIYQRRVAAAWRGARPGGRGAPGAGGQGAPLYICTREGSKVFKAIEKIYEMLNL
jgi:hypothetical protein